MVFVLFMVELLDVINEQREIDKSIKYNLL